jgi:hypothetical protein
MIYWRVRASDGVPEQWEWAWYGNEALALVTALRIEMDRYPEQRASLLNEIDTLHEMKVLLVGIIEPTESAGGNL